MTLHPQPIDSLRCSYCNNIITLFILQGGAPPGGYTPAGGAAPMDHSGAGVYPGAMGDSASNLTPIQQQVLVHYATHNKRVTQGQSKLRLVEDFEMLRLMHDFEMLRLTHYFKTLRVTPARRQPGVTFQNHASDVIFCDHASDVQYDEVVLVEDF